jgi:hypothetical protein
MQVFQITINTGRQFSLFTFSELQRASCAHCSWQFCAQVSGEGVAPISRWDYLINFGFYSCLVH